MKSAQRFRVPVAGLILGVYLQGKGSEGREMGSWAQQQQHRGRTGVWAVFYPQRGLEGKLLPEWEDKKGRGRAKSLPQ